MTYFVHRACNPIRSIFGEKHEWRDGRKRNACCHENITCLDLLVDLDIHIEGVDSDFYRCP